MVESEHHISAECAKAYHTRCGTTRQLLLCGIQNILAALSVAPRRHSVYKLPRRGLVVVDLAYKRRHCARKQGQNTRENSYCRSCHAFHLAILREAFPALTTYIP